MANEITMSGLPFDAVDTGGGNYDRTALSADISRYFGSMFSDGVVVKTALGEVLNTSSQLFVRNDGNQVTVMSGEINIKGRRGWVLSNQVLTIDSNSGGQERHDWVLVELNITQAVRAFTLKVVKGTGGSTTPPALIRNDNITQLGLAILNFNAGATTITSIQDTRTLDQYCGISKVVIGPKAIGNVDTVSVVSTEPSNATSTANPNVLYIWGE